MKLATLNYIHSLLQHEEETKRNAKKIAFQSWEQADKIGADNADTLRDMVEKTRASWHEANDTLQDFEAQEW